MSNAIRQLTISNIPIVYRDVTNLIKRTKNVNLDLSQTTEVDSAGVALICDLKQFAKSNNAIFNIENPSAAFLRLCKLYKITLV